MSEDIVLKSYKNGLRLIMNPDIPIEQLLTSICRKFADSKKFFGDAKLAIALEGRRLSDAEIEAVIQSIERNSGVIVTVVALKDRFFEKEMAQKKDDFYLEKSDDFLKIVNGNVTPDTKVTSCYGLMVTGDILEGASAECGGNLVVLGRIYGNASCGRKTGKKAYILTGGIENANISIGDVSENFSIKKKKRFFSDKNEMIVVTVKNGELDAANFTGSVNV
ncbi:MAG: septum site-determining protein MinC [Lachnospiraceae bacterium]|nr:septum site-determining protein MinC [Lachnospiraceae bacterium]